MKAASLLEISGQRGPGAGAAPRFAADAPSAIGTQLDWRRLTPQENALREALQLRARTG
jgi:hypothetical protein